MPAKAEFRDRGRTEVAVLDSLVGHADEGLTVLDLRSRVDADIDAIESALAALNEDGLITTERENGNLRIYPDERVLPEESDEEENGLLERLAELVPGWLWP
jgi:DNA-binding transcriptional ArsR family regulator